jgi:aldehyde:ferredoxin oxidoreductase
MKTSYPGRVLAVDLSTRSVSKEALPPSWIADFLGGRGVGARTLWENVPPHADPLGEDNVLILAPGVLTGTSAPCSGRTTLLAKGPATGHYLKSSVGGHLGISLKLAGVDLLVIRGCADRPVSLVLDGGDGRIVPADTEWGMTVRETTASLRSRYGEDAEVTCIGPAGERLVRFAAVMTSVYNAAARGGIGAVMGSKRLKAIVVPPARGSVDVADAPAFRAAVQKARDALYNDTVAKDLHRFGTARDVDLLNELHLLPTRNFQHSTMEGDAYALSGRSWAELGLLKRIVGCGGCIYCCHRFTRVPSGPFAGVSSGGPEYETVAAFGSGCGITKIEPVLAANSLCNDLGLDTISTGSVIQWAMESVQRGVLPDERRDGLDISFGNEQAMLELVRRIGYREGLGDLLAEGVARAADVIGAGSQAWAMQARGLEQSNVETRGSLGYALAFAVNPRGPDHLHTECLAEFGGTKEGIDLIERITGDRRLAVPSKEEARGVIVRWHEDMYAVSDALGLCAFATTAAYSLTESLISHLYAAATGRSPTDLELMRAGRRIETLERCFSLREGLLPERDDRLPDRIMSEIAPDLDRGEPVSDRKLKRLLDQYYHLHAWDLHTGRPLASTLSALDLSFAEGVCTPGDDR